MRTATIVGALACAAGLWCARMPAAANGTIDTSGATILSGDSDTIGVTIDPCAPPAPLPPFANVRSIPAQGTFSQPLPALPDTGDGSDGAFQTTTNVSLPGGTYEHTSFTVADGATVTYESAVTLLVRDDVVVDGRIETNAVDASVTVVAGGSIEFLATNGAPVTGVETTSFDAPIRLEAGRRIDLGGTISPNAGGQLPTFQSELRTLLGGITLRAHGPAEDTAAGVFLTETQVAVRSGDLIVGAGRTVLLSGCDVHVEGGAALVQSFGTGMNVIASDVATEFGHLELESHSGLILSGTTVGVRGADVTLLALDGDVRLEGATTVGADDGTVFAFVPVGDGRVTLDAARSVVLSGGSAVTTFGDGGITAFARDGDVALEPTSSFEQSRMTAAGAGPVDLRASRDVVVAALSEVSGEDGPIEMNAGREILHEGDTSVTTSGAVDLRAVAGVRMDTFPLDTEVQNPFVEGDSIRITATDGPVLLQVDYLTTSGGELAILARGDLELGSFGPVQAAADMTLQSLAGSILVRNTTLRTRPRANAGAILIESFGGSTAAIDARGAVVRSGDGVSAPADPVSLLVHQQGAGQIDSFVLPKKVKLKVNAKKPQKSSLKVAGFFDTGSGAQDVAGPATLWVGDIEVAGDLVASGRGFELRDEGLLLKVTPSKSGSSRAKFNLQLKGEEAGGIDPEGPLDLRLSTDGADGFGSVVLEKGGYKLGKKAGLLSAPTLFPFKLQASHKGAGKDALKLQAGLATLGGAPDEIGDVTVRYGDDFEVTVPSVELSRQGDAFVARNPPSAPGVRKLTVDFGREKVTLVAKGLDLGPRPGDAGPRTLAIAIGDEETAVTVRVAPSGKTKAKY